MILASLLAAKAGALMLVGGGPTTREMVKKFADLCGGWNAPIVVLGQTHKDPADASKSRDFLIKEGFSNVQLFADSDLSAERKQALSTAILNSKGIWVPGGDQRLIVTRLGAEWGHSIFSRAIQSGVNWFGTSAGAMCVSDPMLRDDTVEPGFGLIDILIDTHFVKRNREMRMKRAFLRGTAAHSIGLDEGEWVILRDQLIEETHGKPRFMMREQSQFRVTTPSPNRQPARLNQ
jgi:cyanophycinase